MIEVSKTFTFDSAHSLPYLPEGHKCRNLHGHTYGLRVVCRAPIDPEFGWGIDYGDIAAVVKKNVLDWLDHRNIDEVCMTMKTTAENLAVWIFDHLKDDLPVVAIELDETATSRVVYRPNA